MCIVYRHINICIHIYLYIYRYTHTCIHTHKYYCTGARAEVATVFTIGNALGLAMGDALAESQAAMEPASSGIRMYGFFYIVEVLLSGVLAIHDLLESLWGQYQGP